MGPVHTGSESLGYEIGRQGTMTRYLEGSLNYNRLFGNHRVGALFLYNQKIHTNTQAATAMQHYLIRTKACWSCDVCFSRYLFCRSEHGIQRI